MNEWQKRTTFLVRVRVLLILILCLFTKLAFGKGEDFRPNSICRFQEATWWYLWDWRPCYDEPPYLIVYSKDGKRIIVIEIKRKMFYHKEEPYEWDS